MLQCVVHYQLLIVLALVVAELAFYRFLVSVQHLMPDQGSFIGEPLKAIPTKELLNFVAVDLGMPLQLGDIPTAVITFITADALALTRVVFEVVI